MRWWWIGLMSTSLMALEGNWYGGMDMAKGQQFNVLSLIDDQNDATRDYRSFALKVGMGDDGATKLQGSLEFIDHTSSPLGGDNHTLVEAGADLIQEFDPLLMGRLYPYLLGGLAYGTMRTNAVNEGSIHELSARFGVGVNVLIDNRLSCNLGAQSVFRRYNAIDTGSSTFEPKSNTLKLYIGLNYRF